MNKNIAIIGVLVLVLVGGAAFLIGEAPASTVPVATLDSQKVDANEVATTTSSVVTKEIQNNNEAQVVNAIVASGYTLSEVAKHNDTKSCWVIISGNVYDLTNWISEHPGGQETILGACGKDATSEFVGAHGDSKKIVDLLATMKIGAVR